MKTVAILFGGPSEEYDISLRSATNVLASIAVSPYEILPIGITKQGEWFAYFGPWQHILDNTWCTSYDELTPVTPVREGFLLAGESAPRYPIATIPLLHGAFGEDGKLQGLLDSLSIPYIGCGCESSAVAMNKHLSKLAVSFLHIPTAKWICVKQADIATPQNVIDAVSKNIGFPAFVKPACCGSSIGATPVHAPEALIAAIEKALLYDTLILVEEHIFGMECEVALFQDHELLVSSPGAVFSHQPFYDYHTKYTAPDVQLSVPAPLPLPVSNQMCNYAKQIFLALGCRHISRVDFFYDIASQTIYFNEINTMPGMTPRSLYPALMANMGLSLSTLINRLVQEVAM